MCRELLYLCDGKIFVSSTADGTSISVFIPLYTKDQRSTGEISPNDIESNVSIRENTSSNNLKLSSKVSADDLHSFHSHSFIDSLNKVNNSLRSNDGNYGHFNVSFISAESNGPDAIPSSGNLYSSIYRVVSMDAKTKIQPIMDLSYNNFLESIQSGNNSNPNSIPRIHTSSTNLSSLDTSNHIINKTTNKSSVVYHDNGSLLNILIVDDSPSFRKLLKQSLRRLGYVRVDEAADGPQAQKMVEEEYARSKYYNCVFVDFEMVCVSILSCWYQILYFSLIYFLL